MVTGLDLRLINSPHTWVDISKYLSTYNTVRPYPLVMKLSAFDMHNDGRHVVACVIGHGGNCAIWLLQPSCSTRKNKGIYLVYLGRYLGT